MDVLFAAVPQRSFFFLFLFLVLILIIVAGQGIGCAVFESGINAVPALDRIKAAFPEFDVMLPIMLAVLAGRFLHGDHLNM